MLNTRCITYWNNKTILLSWSWKIIIYKLLEFITNNVSLIFLTSFSDSRTIYFFLKSQLISPTKLEKAQSIGSAKFILISQRNK